MEETLVANPIVVKTGTQLTITANNRPSYADGLTMEDGSSIRVLVDWSFECPRVLVGSNCFIDATGGAGRNGADQAYIPGQAGECRGGDGRAALPGEDGQSGGNGANLQFVWGIETIGQLVIRTNGGNGGSGGHGGQGQQGGGATCTCNGQNGGSGGRGGAGGNGGNAGPVSILWYPTVKHPSNSEITGLLKPGFNAFVQFPGLYVESSGGNPGVGGVEGSGGRGGDGKDCWPVHNGGGGPGYGGGYGQPGHPGASYPPAIVLIKHP